MGQLFADFVLALLEGAVGVQVGEALDGDVAPGLVASVGDVVGSLRVEHVAHFLYILWPMSTNITCFYFNSPGTSMSKALQ